MTQLNIANVRLILDSYSRMGNMDAIFYMPFDYSDIVKNGYSACYTITEKDYVISDNYKIGCLGISHMLVPDANFYISDLRTLIENSSNPYAGFYEIIESDTFQVDDIVSFDVCHDGKKLFDIPFIIVGEDNVKFYIKPIIETFEKPQKKSFMDIITRNPYWNCTFVGKTELTHKYRKLAFNDIVQDDDLDDDYELALSTHIAD